MSCIHICPVRCAWRLLAVHAGETGPPRRSAAQRRQGGPCTFVYVVCSMFLLCVLGLYLLLLLLMLFVFLPDLNPGPRNNDNSNNDNSISNPHNDSIQWPDLRPQPRRSGKLVFLGGPLEIRLEGGVATRSRRITPPSCNPSLCDLLLKGFLENRLPDNIWLIC